MNFQAGEGNWEEGRIGPKRGREEQEILPFILQLHQHEVCGGEARERFREAESLGELGLIGSMKVKGGKKKY